MIFSHLSSFIGTFTVIKSSHLLTYIFLDIAALSFLAALNLAIGLREKNKVQKRAFLVWAAGYILLIGDKAPIILITFGYLTSAAQIFGIYSFAFAAYIAGLLLIAGGFALQFSEGKWFAKMLSALLATTLAFAAVAYFFSGSFAIAFWVIKLCTYITVAVNVAVAFTICITGKKTAGDWQTKAGFASFLVGWTIFEVARLYMWHAVSTSEDAWLTVIFKIPGVFGALFIAKVFLIVGTLFISTHHFSLRKKGRIKEILFIDLLIILSAGLLLIFAGYAFRLIAAEGSGVYSLEKEDSGTVTMHKPFTVALYAQSDNPFNVVSGTVTVPKSFRVVSLSDAHAGVPLWQQAPTGPDSDGNIIFSGAIPNGTTGKILILELTLDPEEGGMLTIPNAVMLANDGQGTDMSVDRTPLFIEVLTEHQSRVDLNGDGVINLNDLSQLLSHWGERGKSSADLNGDGVVGLPDLSVFLSGFSNSRVGTRAYLP